METFEIHNYRHLLKRAQELNENDKAAIEQWSQDVDFARRQDLISSDMRTTLYQHLFLSTTK